MFRTSGTSRSNVPNPPPDKTHRPETSPCCDQPPTPPRTREKRNRFAILRISSKTRKTPPARKHKITKRTHFSFPSPPSPSTTYYAIPIRHRKKRTHFPAHLFLGTWNLGSGTSPLPSALRLPSSAFPKPIHESNHPQIQLFWPNQTQSKGWPVPDRKKLAASTHPKIHQSGPRRPIPIYSNPFQGYTLPAAFFVLRGLGRALGGRCDMSHPGKAAPSRPHSKNAPPASPVTPSINPIIHKSNNPFPRSCQIAPGASPSSEEL